MTDLSSERPVRFAEAVGARQVMAFAALLLIACVSAAQVKGGLWRVVQRNDDNQKYSEMAAAIEKGDLRLATPTKYPWGFPFAIAAVSEVFSSNNIESLFFVSVCSSSNHR